VGNIIVKNLGKTFWGVPEKMVAHTLFFYERRKMVFFKQWGRGAKNFVFKERGGDNK